MALVQRDYILRLIEQVARAIARLLKRKSEGDLPGARREVHQAIVEVLGPAAAMALMTDSRTAANLVSDPRRLHLWCRLLEEDRQLLQLMERPADAATVDRRMVELLLESWMREPHWDDETRALFLAARERGAALHLDASYRAQLAAWEAEQR
jgi:hypothetical protein